MSTARFRVQPTVSAGPVSCWSRATGALANASLTTMSGRSPWFRRLGADQRAGVRVLPRTGTANFAARLG